MSDFIIREDVTLSDKDGRPRDHTHYYKGQLVGFNEWTARREDAHRFDTRGLARKFVREKLGSGRPRLTIEVIECAAAQGV